jgi:transposase
MAKYDNKEQHQDRINQAYELRLSGKTYRQIGAELGVSHVTAMKWVTEHLSNVTLPLVDEVRKQEVDRMQRQLDRLEEQSEQGDLKAIGLIVKISERLCKMLGADIPVVQTVEHVEKAQIDKDIQKLLEDMSERNRAAKELAARKGVDDASESEA